MEEVLCLPQLLGLESNFFTGSSVLVINIHLPSKRTPASDLGGVNRKAVFYSPRIVAIAHVGDQRIAASIELHIKRFDNVLSFGGVFAGLPEVETAM